MDVTSGERGAREGERTGGSALVSGFEKMGKGGASRALSEEKISLIYKEQMNK